MIVACYGSPSQSFVFGPKPYAQHPFNFQSAPSTTISGAVWRPQERGKTFERIHVTPIFVQTPDLEARLFDLHFRKSILFHVRTLSGVASCFVVFIVCAKSVIHFPCLSMSNSKFQKFLTRKIFRPEGSMIVACCSKPSLSFLVRSRTLKTLSISISGAVWRPPHKREAATKSDSRPVCDLLFVATVCGYCLWKRSSAALQKIVTPRQHWVSGWADRCRLRRRHVPAKAPSEDTK